MKLEQDQSSEILPCRSAKSSLACESNNYLSSWYTDDGITALVSRPG
jgi:hypothetical protein